jgi:hypothetical protein
MEFPAYPQQMWITLWMTALRRFKNACRKAAYYGLGNL